QPDNARFQRVTQLDQLDKDAGIEAICRILRIESSAQLSKQAALLLLTAPAEPRQLWLDRAGVIEASLGDSQRPAAAWLRTQTNFHTQGMVEQEAGLADWKKYTQAEQVLLKANSDETNRGVVLALLRH